ncbi:hypothetical protein E2C01_079141 [Portunus trituberculatus]|uniref:Uncharacterized protein n=1 Tax=Portunus trituberculatus TaxID=210409 RepID=A0A5B7IPU7_PORTR|nr:hypothetical protein [Portunus trituberculatus]
MRCLGLELTVHSLRTRTELLASTSEGRMEVFT